MSQFDTQHTPPDDKHRGHGHGWMMMICCIPMLVIAIVLVATGVASSRVIFGAVACGVMMFMMMRMMGGMGGKEGERK